MASQVIYEKAVRHNLPSAFVTSLERIDEFVIGAVLVRHHKQHWYHDNSLDFTSAPLQCLLSKSEKQDFSFQTQTDTLLTGESESKETSLDINLGIDGDVKAAIVSVGGKMGGHVNDSTTLSFDFGKITHTISNMYEAISIKQYKVDLKHPVVQDAVEKGKTFFIITSLYTASKVEIALKKNVGLDTDDSVKEGVDVPVGPVKGEDVDTNFKIDDEHKDTIVTKRDLSTNIGFHIMKVDIGRNGELIPKDKSGYEHAEKIHYPYGDVFAMENAKFRSQTQPQDKDVPHAVPNTN